MQIMKNQLLHPKSTQKAQELLVQINGPRQGAEKCSETPILHKITTFLVKFQEIWKMAKDIGGEKYVNFVIKNTHTCYKGDRVNFNEWGYGCGECPACILRSKGWKKFKKYNEQ